MKEKPPFTVPMSPTAPSSSSQYNPLRDPYLASYVSRPSVRKALAAVGKIEHGRLLIDDTKYYRKVALLERAGAARASVTETKRREHEDRRYVERKRAEVEAERQRQIETVRKRQALEMMKREMLKAQDESATTFDATSASHSSPTKFPALSKVPGKEPVIFTALGREYCSESIVTKSNS